MGLPFLVNQPTHLVPFCPFLPDQPTIPKIGRPLWMFPNEEINEESEAKVDSNDDNIICSCCCCCCICGCIKSISKIGIKARKNTDDDKNKLCDDGNESIDLTKSQKRDLFALQNYGLFRNNTNTYRYY